MSRSIVQEKVKDQVQEALMDGVKDRVEEKVFDSSEDLFAQGPKTERFKADDHSNRVIELFNKHFKSGHLTKLGFPKITLRSGKWYLPWDSGEFEAELEPDPEIKDAKKTRPSTLDAAQQSLRELNTYLTHKLRRRKDSSFLAETYKTLLAKLCHKLIERIELLNDRKQKLFFYQLLRQFLSDIWEEATLLNPQLRGDTSGLHLEDFIYAEMQLVEERLCYLSCDEPSSELTTWADTLDQELAAIHLCGARTFHFLLQNKSIPDNLDKHLKTLSSTYQRLSAIDDKTEFSGKPLKIINSRRKHWNGISQAAKNKLAKAHYPGPYDFLSLVSLIQKGVIRFEEAIFLESAEYYSADQCLYLALYSPQDLPLTVSEKIDLFGTDEFLALYRTSKNPLTGFQWLTWHIQEASAKLSALDTLLQIDPQDHDVFHQHLKHLILQVRNLREASQNCPDAKELGVLPELAKIVSYQTDLLTEFERHLIKLQQHLHSLVLIRTLLSQYRQILPQTGELIGALAFQTDFSLLVEVSNQTIKDVQTEIAHLTPLQGMGFTGSLDGSQSWMVSKQTGLLDLVNGIKKLSKGLTLWRSHRSSREKSLHDLEIRLAIAQEHLYKVHAILSPKRVEQVAHKVKKQFNLARIMLSEGLKDHLSEKQRAKLKQGEAVITQWFSVIDAGLSEQKLTETKEGREHKEKSSCADERSLDLSSQKKKTTSTPKKNHFSEKSRVLTDYLDDLRNKAQRLLNIKSKDSFKDWQHFIFIEQESFFTELGKIKEEGSDENWLSFFKDQLGFIYSPLPQIEEPQHFLWWHRHTIHDRQLFFNLLMINGLMTGFKLQSPTSIQKNNLEQIINVFQNALQKQQASAWKWLDPIRCYLKSKLKVSSLRINHLAQEMSGFDGLLATPEEKIIVEIKPKEHKAQALEPEKQESPKVQLPSVLRPECKPGSKTWLAYEEKLKQLHNLEKQKSMVVFFSSALFHIEKAQLSISENPEVTLRFKAVIGMFLEVIKVTPFMDSILGVAISSLYKSFNENSPAVCQQFFIKQAKTIIKNYPELLQSTEIPAFTASL